KLEAFRRILLRLLRRDRSPRVDIRSCANAFPVIDRAVGRAVSNIFVPASNGPAISVVVAGHYYCSLQSTRQIPEAWQWPARYVHRQDHVGKQPLLFVRLRNGNFAQIEIIRHAAAKKEIVGTDRSYSVALLT